MKAKLPEPYRTLSPSRSPQGSFPIDYPGKTIRPVARLGPVIKEVHGLLFPLEVLLLVGALALADAMGLTTPVLAAARDTIGTLGALFYIWIQGLIGSGRGPFGPILVTILDRVYGAAKGFEALLHRENRKVILAWVGVYYGLQSGRAIFTIKSSLSEIDNVLSEAVRTELVDLTPSTLNASLDSPMSRATMRLKRAEPEQSPLAQVHVQDPFHEHRLQRRASSTVVPVIRSRQERETLSAFNDGKSHNILSTFFQRCMTCPCDPKGEDVDIPSLNIFATQLKTSQKESPVEDIEIPDPRTLEYEEGGVALIQLEYFNGRLARFSRIRPSRVFYIDNDLFKGVGLVRLRDINDRQEYFEGRRRLHQFVIQGKFKKSIPCSSLWGGQKWPRRWQNLPPSFVVRGALRLARLLNPSLQEDFLGPEPFMLYPQIACPQKVHVARNNQEAPSIDSDYIEEDCSLLVDQITGERPFVNSPAKTRRNFFSKNLDKLQNFYYDPAYIYTLEDYQDLFNMQTFSYKIPGMTIRVANKLLDMPIEMTCLHFTPTDISNAERTGREFKEAPDRVVWQVQLYNKEGVDLAE